MPTARMGLDSISDLAQDFVVLISSLISKLLWQARLRIHLATVGLSAY